MPFEAVERNDVDRVDQKPEAGDDEEIGDANESREHYVRQGRGEFLSSDRGRERTERALFLLRGQVQCSRSRGGSGLCFHRPRDLANIEFDHAAFASVPAVRRLLATRRFVQRV